MGRIVQPNFSTVALVPLCENNTLLTSIIRWVFLSNGMSLNLKYPSLYCGEAKALSQL